MVTLPMLRPMLCRAEKFKMFDVGTRLVMAAMMNLLSFGNWAVRLLPRNQVRPAAATLAGRHLGIAARINTACNSAVVVHPGDAHSASTGSRSSVLHVLGVSARSVHALAVKLMSLATRPASVRSVQVIAARLMSSHGSGGLNQAM